jgi:hypothetical protein
MGRLPPNDLLSPRFQRIVNLAAKLIAHNEKDHQRRGQNGKSHRCRSDESQSRAETEVSKAHGSRSA